MEICAIDNERDPNVVSRFQYRNLRNGALAGQPTLRYHVNILYGIYCFCGAIFLEPEQSVGQRSLHSKYPNGIFTPHGVTLFRSIVPTIGSLSTNRKRQTTTITVYKQNMNAHRDSCMVLHVCANGGWASNRGSSDTGVLCRTGWPPPPSRMPRRSLNNTSGHPHPNPEQQAAPISNNSPMQPMDDHRNNTTPYIL